ncbi:MAG: TolC family protein [Elusimicrobia bacterium]|nr:TolC family protein [Elusimicrobiota bacterium]
MKGVKQHSIFLLAAAVLFCVSRTLYAEDNPRGIFFSDILTWRDCLELTIKNNPQYIIAQKNLETARLNYNLAVNQYTPSANIQYGFQKSNYDILNQQNYWSLTASANQNIFNWEALSNIRIQKENTNQAAAQLQQTSAAVLYGLKQAYLAMLYAQQSVELYKNIYEIRKKSADMIRLQYEGGNESIGNNMRASALAVAANNGIKAAQRNLVVARKNLVAVLGVDIGNTFTLKDTLAPAASKPVDINSAAENTPQIIISKNALQIARLQLSSSKAGILPVLAAGGTWGLQDDKPDLRNASTIWTVSVMLSYPIFSGGITAAKENIDIAKTALEQSEEALKQQYFTTRAQLQAASAALETDIDTIDSNKLLLASAEQMDKEANIQYLAGMMDFQIWQSVEQDLVNYKSAYLTSLYTANLDSASLDNILGTGLEKINE